MYLVNLIRQISDQYKAALSPDSLSNRTDTKNMNRQSYSQFSIVMNVLLVFFSLSEMDEIERCVETCLGTPKYIEQKLVPTIYASPNSTSACERSNMVVGDFPCIQALLNAMSRWIPLENTYYIQSSTTSSSGDQRYVHDHNNDMKDRIHLNSIDSTHIYTHKKDAKLPKSQEQDRDKNASELHHISLLSRRYGPESMALHEQTNVSIGNTQPRDNQSVKQGENENCLRMTPPESQSYTTQLSPSAILFALVYSALLSPRTDSKKKDTVSIHHCMEPNIRKSMDENKGSDTDSSYHRFIHTLKDAYLGFHYIPISSSMCSTSTSVGIVDITSALPLLRNLCQFGWHRRVQQPGQIKHHESSGMENEISSLPPFQALFTVHKPKGSNN